MSDVISKFHESLFESLLRELIKEKRINGSLVRGTYIPKIFEVSVFDSYSGELRRLRGLCRWRRWSLGCRSEAGTCSSESGDEPQDIQRDLESVTWITVRAATRYLLFVDKLS